MAGIFESEVGKKATIGTKLDVQTCFSFQFRDKAIEPSQAIAIGLDVPEKYTVWPVEFCNTEVDRHNERFTKSVLDVFAAQMNARNFTFNLFHRSDKGIGKTLGKATVEQTGMGYVLKGYIAISDKAKLPDQDIFVNDAVKDGIYTDVSVEISGTTEYISDSTGNRGVWEYYVDAERPNRTQFMGAALVAMGAQIGATIVKSIDGGDKEKEQSKAKNMNHFSDKFLIGGELLAVKSAEENGAVKVEGIDAIVTKANDALKSVAELTTAKESAEAELKAFREPLEAEVANLQTILKETPTDTKTMKAAELVTIAKGLRAKADAGEAKNETTTSKQFSYFDHVNKK